MVHWGILVTDVIHENLFLGGVVLLSLRCADISFVKYFARLNCSIQYDSVGSVSCSVDLVDSISGRVVTHAVGIEVHILKHIV
jgi:hypothetical protein